MPGVMERKDTQPKKVVILGSTGSIGTSALKVAREIPDYMEVVGLAAGRQAGMPAGRHANYLVLSIR